MHHPPPPLQLLLTENELRTIVVTFPEFAKNKSICRRSPLPPPPSFPPPQHPPGSAGRRRAADAHHDAFATYYNPRRRPPTNPPADDKDEAGIYIWLRLLLTQRCVQHLPLERHAKMHNQDIANWTQGCFSVPCAVPTDRSLRMRIQSEKNAIALTAQTQSLHRETALMMACAYTMHIRACNTAASSHRQARLLTASARAASPRPVVEPEHPLYQAVCAPLPLASNLEALRG